MMRVNNPKFLLEAIRNALKHRKNSLEVKRLILRRFRDKHPSKNKEINRLLILNENLCIINDSIYLHNRWDEDGITTNFLGSEFSIAMKASSQIKVLSFFLGQDYQSY